MWWLVRSVEPAGLRMLALQRHVRQYSSARAPRAVSLSGMARLTLMPDPATQSPADPVQKAWLATNARGFALGRPPTAPAPSSSSSWPTTPLEPFPSKKPSLLWRAASQLFVGAVGWWSILMLRFFEKTHTYNLSALRHALDHRPAGTPLITIANHVSCLDEPLIWGTLNFADFQPHRMRWSVGASDICFTNPVFSFFFGAGQTLPIVRGAGVYQPCMDFAVELLNAGRWIHIFPEGKVVQTGNMIPFKWGVGQLIVRSATTPVVVPIYHRGLEDVLPESFRPRIPRPFKRVDVLYGEPIELDELLASHRKRGSDEQTMRKAVTDLLEARMHELKCEFERRVA
ncbi:acyltransferase [Capsaspora owczarzaki ATCC 30864]|uniref:Tafazzin family protein n=1 Tax=Capsaspora owczarzaki (strain ATCC 30864) TaxID=595528 RepID=A0A0D2X0T4_CAPO3|nr:acyltransferase [Capsaspora owczarzaki ATCC 30864]KJE89614.1 acyltransferase [Capsaspora owczarzaki ATCC 30864]|eukprot:XP_004365919.2 acyltransferase [Capsaspora owczarzaki ATCC 30864]